MNVIDVIAAAFLALGFVCNFLASIAALELIYDVHTDIKYLRREIDRLSEDDSPECSSK